MMSVIMLSVIMLNVRMLNGHMLNVVILNVVMLNVVILNVVIPSVLAPSLRSYCLTDAASILVGDGVYWTDTPISSGHPLDGLHLIRSHPARPPLREIRASCQTVKRPGPYIIKLITAVIYRLHNKLECFSLYTRLGWKGLQGTNTLAYCGNRKLWP
jgi:hypothetical protein